MTALRRADFVCGVIDPAPFPSRARELVESGLLDRAARIAGAMEAEFRQRSGGAGAAAELRSLRSAAFAGIAQNIMNRLEMGRR